MLIYNNAKKEVKHEIEFVSKNKHQLTMLILKANIELLTLN